MRHARYALLSAIISASLVGSSTAVAASSAPLAQPAQPDRWMVLSMVTPSGVAALGAAGATAAQTEAPQPPPAHESPDTTLLMIGSVAILAGLLALAVSQGEHHHNQQISPD